MVFQPPLSGLADTPVSERMRFVLALTQFREEWQETIDGGSLLKVEVSIGLVLADIAERLEMTAQERHVFLGSKLAQEVDLYLEHRVGRKFLV